MGEPDVAYVDDEQLRSIARPPPSTPPPLETTSNSSTSGYGGKGKRQQRQVPPSNFGMIVPLLLLVLLLPCAVRACCCAYCAIAICLYLPGSISAISTFAMRHAHPTYNNPPGPAPDKNYLY